MAEKEIARDKGKESKDTGKSAKKKPAEEEYSEMIIRVMGYDLPGSKSIYTALTRIKGISWSISNAVCLKLNYPKSKKISELTKDELKNIESFLKELPIYDFLKNRRLDPETGKTGHNFGTNLEITRDFDIKRMKKIKSYKGIRHTAKLPVRGQRTRSHFRTRGKASGMGVKKKAQAPAAGGLKK